MNEPWLGSYTLDTFEPSALQPFYERVIPAVREVAPHWLAFVEPMSMSNLGRDTQLTTMPFDDVVYAPHSYDNSAEQGDGFDENNRAQILDKLVKLAGEARAMNAALWIGEYGGDGAIPTIGAYMDAEYDAFSSVFAGSSYWDDSRGPGYGLLNDDGTEKTASWDAVVRPAPERIAGTPGTWTYDEVARELTVTFTAAGGASSTFRAPSRVYPGGAIVDCTACDAVVDGDTVEVSADAGAAVTVVLRPAP
jgi:hypothetical protein